MCGVISWLPWWRYIFLWLLVLMERTSRLFKHTFQRLCASVDFFSFRLSWRVVISWRWIRLSYRFLADISGVNPVNRRCYDVQVKQHIFEDRHDIIEATVRLPLDFIDYIFFALFLFLLPGIVTLVTSAFIVTLFRVIWVVWATSTFISTATTWATYWPRSATWLIRARVRSALFLFGFWFAFTLLNRF